MRDEECGNNLVTELDGGVLSDHLSWRNSTHLHGVRKSNTIGRTALRGELCTIRTALCEEFCTSEAALDDESYAIVTARGDCFKTTQAYG